MLYHYKPVESFLFKDFKMESLPRSKQLNAYFRENAVIKLIFNLNYIKFKFNDIS